MATIVNTTPTERRDTGSGFLLGVVLLIAFLALLFFYGVPALGSAFRANTPSVQVPGKIDVNVNNPSQ